MNQSKNNDIYNKTPHKKHDYVMKNLIGDNPQEFIDIFHLDYGFVEMLPTENVDLLEKGFQMDSLMRVKNENNDGTKLLNFEFQSSSPTNKKLKNMAAYTLLSNIKYDEEVETIVVNNEDGKIGEIEKEICNNIIFKYFNTTLKFINARNTLNIITDKINNNKKLTSNEILKLKLIPYADTEDKMEGYFEEACILAKNIKQDCIREEVKQIHRFLIKTLVKEEEKRERLLMITREESLLYQDGLKAKEAELKPIIKEKDKRLEEKDKRLEEKDKRLEEKDKRLEEKDQKIEELQKKIEKLEQK